MKYFTTLLALLLSCSMLAQGPVEFPYNPDSDGDDFIGVNDLMALLGEFDSVFSEEGLYLSEDSLSAFYDSGSMNYIECQLACSNLPGRWKMPKLSEALIPNQSMWLNTSEGDMVPDGNQLKALTLDATWGVESSLTVSSKPCYCFTKELPKVEYTYCMSGSGIGECANEKVAEGWLPQGGIHVTQDGIVSQAFWRWAD